MRSLILSRIQGHEDETFSSLGVSPIMGIGLLEKAVFYLIGEESKGKNITKGIIKNTSWSILTDESGQIKINDITNGKFQVLSSLKNYTKLKVGTTIDPDLRTQNINDKSNQ